MKKNPLALILALLLLASENCYPASLSFMDRAYGIQQTALRFGFSREYIETGNFSLLTYHRINKPSGNIRIYIEGDGRAWESRNRLSRDPTPSDPMALKLSIADNSDNVAYLARPGQFPDPEHKACDATYWSGKRFAPEVVEALDKAIDILKGKALAKNVELVGYSGGGALAVLLAAGRSDVVAIRTVAGNLDPNGLSVYHKVSFLEGSMDPLDVAHKIAIIPQRHFVGAKDKVVPISIVESFVRKEGDANCESITIVNSATHNDGWRERWAELLSMPLEY